eukprot:GHVS01089097.1.p1 GENE.GHVS01089097.1~~GHVS01089097.1.p1  ORF type:complete len:180 (+),score=34.99 GHVS01089097.1:93-632(+)
MWNATRQQLLLPTTSPSSSSISNLFFRLSYPRYFGGSKVYLGKRQDFNQWENEVPPKLQKTIVPIGRGPVASAVSGKVARQLRGSGLHGPEHGDVCRLVLWNRLKGRRPQRDVPTIGELQSWNKQELGIRWLLWAVIFFYAPMAWYGRGYSKQHDHYPWLPARTDGSRGEGCFWWFNNY